MLFLFILLRCIIILLLIILLSCMQKNKIILMLAILFLFSPFASLVAVETIDTTAIKTTTKISESEIKKNADALKAQVLKERTDNLRNSLKIRELEIAKTLSRDTTNKKIKLEAKAQERIRVIINKIYTKINNQLSKLSILGARMSLKINAFEQEGKDVTALKAQYIIAKAAIEKARVESISTNTVFSSEISLEISKEDIRSLVKTTEESIRTAGGEYKKLLPLFAKLEGNN